MRTTEDRFRTARTAEYRTAFFSAQGAVLKAGASPRDGATILRDRGAGRVPTIVLGGLVPDSSEQVFLLRGFLLKSGDVYYLNYPREGFSLDLLCAQLDDLVTELAELGQPPVVFGVSFGAGLVLEWLRRARLAGREPAVGGIVLVSPVACVADLIAPGTAKPATLLGRAVKPFLDPAAPATPAAVEKSRTIFLRLFDAGAQNKSALRALMTAAESARLRAAVMATVRGISVEGARQRVQSLAAMQAPTGYFVPGLLPLSPAPALVLFAQCEDAVLDPGSPTRFALERAHRAYFPQSTVRQVVARPSEAPVQHASLIFHRFEFLRPLQGFYHGLRQRSFPLAA